MDQQHGEERSDQERQANHDVELLRDLYLRGKLSRRAFLRSAAALGSAAFLAACGGPPAAQQPQATSAPAAPTTAPAAPAPTTAPEATSAPAPTTAAEQATEAPAAAQPTETPAAAQPTETPAAEQPTEAPAAGQPKVGGTYRIFSSGDFRSLDPPAAEGSEDWWSAGMVLYNMLYFFDKDGKFYADLAADMPKLSTDAKIYTIPLRQGVKFHNGRVMVADDVKFSLERQLWPDVYSWGKTYMDNVVGYKDVIDGKTKDLAGVKVIDPNTIEITLDHPQAVFPNLLAMSMNAIVPKQETLDACKDWGIKKVIGTGPFKFVEWVQGQHAVYVRNPDYFRAGLPYLERIELNLKVEPAIQMLHWESKEAEMIRNIPPAERDRILNDPEQSKLVRSAAVLSVLRLGMHHKVKPFDDLKVRQAVAMAIDKEAVAQEAGGIMPPLEGYFAIPMLQYDKNFKTKYPYDPDKAKALLTEAGHADGIKGITLRATPQAIGELIQSDLKAVGIEVTLNTEDAPGYRDHVRSGEWALFVYGWAASFPDAFDYVSAWTTCAADETGYNDGMYCDQRIDDLLAKAEKLPQQDPQRIAAYREIEDIVINQDVGFVGLYNEQGRALGVANVHDDFQSSIYTGWPYLETAWMD